MEASPPRDTLAECTCLPKKDVKLPLLPSKYPQLCWGDALQASSLFNHMSLQLLFVYSHQLFHVHEVVADHPHAACADAKVLSHPSCTIPVAAITGHDQQTAYLHMLGEAISIAKRGSKMKHADIDRIL